MQALDVDKELSPMVRRSFALVPPAAEVPVGRGEGSLRGVDVEASHVELRTLYEAATNRLLRVAVNGFMESMIVVLGVILELDVDVMAELEE